MLAEGKKYTEIADSTGLSTATISRVNRALKYGSDGYTRALSRIEYEE
jgi:TrpR-related protein YerC/YecD